MHRRPERLSPKDHLVVEIVGAAPDWNGLSRGRAGTTPRKTEHLGRQIRFVNGARSRAYDQPLDQVLELAHVARPIVGDERGARWRSHFGHWRRVAVRVSAE